MFLPGTLPSNSGAYKCSIEMNKSIHATVAFQKELSVHLHPSYNTHQLYPARELVLLLFPIREQNCSPQGKQLKSTP